MSPNSFTMTAVRANSGSRKILLIRVVLPLPRNPVMTEVGIKRLDLTLRHGNARP